MQTSAASKFPPVDPRWVYRIKFDQSLGLDEIWVDSLTLDYLNSLRENIFVSQSFPVSAMPCPQPEEVRATRNQPKRKSKLSTCG